MIFALFRIGALPVFALPAHREAEIGYFCEFTEAVAYVIPDTARRLRPPRRSRRRSAHEVPTLRHVFVVGEPGEHTALSEVPCRRRPER